ncbi:MAG: peptide chain release factor N(5)-glutamine methyltransferase [Verrucomicrobia bacterium]|nr:peptide chain release factor N(5)-glutamine methyltransferase [Verrucomicrobiota bacterium]
MKTLQAVLKLATEFLSKQGVSRPRLTAETLLAHFLKLKRIELYMHFDRPLTEEELAPFREALKRAIKGEPVEYIMGEVEFYGAKLKITPAVLIPRQETEILLDMVCKQLDGTEKRALDLCTGSGCLAIGLKRARPDLEVVAVDLSKEALEVARANSGEIEWLQGDLTAPLQGKFDLVLCNPPYITTGDYATLDRSVRDFEPKMALDAGPTGYEFFERLSIELPPFLNEGAKVFFEIGASQGKEVLKIFSTGPWEGQTVKPDWAGHDRFFSLLKSKQFSSILG